VDFIVETTMEEEMNSTEYPETENPILRLPSAPVYMSIIRTLEGKPVGIPIWNSFIHQEDRTMTNEAMSSTFLQLAKNIADLAADTEQQGKVVRVTLEERSYNIFSPHKSSPFQISFVVVFEAQDTVLIKAKHKEELVRLVIQSLQSSKQLKKFLASELKSQIQPGSSLYTRIEQTIAKVVKKWDDKRVKYIEKKAKEERERLIQLAKEQAQLQEDLLESTFDDEE
jgi:hypothetical protein